LTQRRHNIIVVSVLPPFDPQGRLPPGVHSAEWQEFVQRFGWTPHRRRLIHGLQRALENLRNAGCLTAYIDGSFVTNVERPGDFDACWDLVGVDLAKVDVVLKSFGNRRALQKAKYLGELFPASFKADVSGRTFLDFFQTDKTTGEPKGIVSISLKGLP